MLKKLKQIDGTSTGDVIIFFICLVVFLTIVVRCIDFFQPINKYYQMKEICKAELYDISLTGGLESTKRDELSNSLGSIGLKNVKILYPVSGAPKVKLGDKIRLRVEAEFSYSTITAYLTRTKVTERYVYDKTQVQKKLTN